MAKGLEKSVLRGILYVIAGFSLLPLFGSILNQSHDGAVIAWFTFLLILVGLAISAPGE